MQVQHLLEFPSERDKVMPNFWLNILFQKLQKKGKTPSTLLRSKTNLGKLLLEI